MTFGALAAWQAWLLVLAAGAAAAALFLVKVRPPRVVVPSLLLWARVLSESREKTFWERIRRAVSLVITVAVALALVSLLALSGTPMAVDSAGNPDLTRLTPYARIIFSLAGIALIFLSVRFLPLAAVVVEENSGVIQSMRRSFALTRGHFFRLLAFLVVTGIVIIVASRAVIVVVGSVAQLLLGKAEPWSLSLLVTAFAAGAMQMVLTAIYTSMIARLSAQLGADSRQR